MSLLNEIKGLSGLNEEAGVAETVLKVSKFMGVPNNVQGQRLYKILDKHGGAPQGSSSEIIKNMNDVGWAITEQEFQKIRGQLEKQYQEVKRQQGKQDTGVEKQTSYK